MKKQGIFFKAKTKYNEVFLRRVKERVELEVKGASFGAWHPRVLLTGYYWDAVTAGCFLHSPSPPSSILLLGLGGGTVVHQINFLMPDAKITAIEIDEELVQIAREYLHLDEAKVKAIFNDAYEFLEKSPQKFDAIIDDLFISGSIDAFRPDVDFEEKLILMKNHLNPQGIMLVNLITTMAHTSQRQAGRKAIKKHFPFVRVLRPGEGANEVLISGEKLQKDECWKSKENLFKQAFDKKCWNAMTAWAMK